MLDRDCQSYLPAGRLLFDFSLPGTVSGYSRELNLDSAVAQTSFLSGGVRFRRDWFASYPDQMIVIRLSADRKEPCRFPPVSTPRFTAVPAAPEIPSASAGSARCSTGEISSSGVTKKDGPESVIR